MLKVRDIARVSLLCSTLLFTQADAVPWREKNAFKIATSLPKRLIDSIMAQGNWNILFQEGPFSEFQRQIAIANHFALRGDARQANFYFQKAGTALDIAYASLRGKFGWPRDPKPMTTAGLPWGDNRETFEDFLLCRLQLEIESMLVQHETGLLKTTGFENLVGETERQLGAPLRQKDQDLDQMVGFVRDAVAIRSKKENPQLTAEKFAALSDKITPSVRNYWQRRLFIFRIFENIHHGNAGRARFLAQYLEDKQKDQIDAMGLARIYIHAGVYTEAKRVLEAALRTDENKATENFTDYLGYSGAAQNLLIRLGLKSDAETVSRETLQLLTGHRKTGNIPRDEIVDLEKAIRNEELRLKMHAFANRGACPAPAAYTAESDMDQEWRMRERLFFEGCNQPREKTFWSTLLKNPSSSLDARAVAAYHLADVKEMKAQDKNSSPLIRHLMRRRALADALARDRREKLPELTIAYLNTLNSTWPEFALFDWGINLSDDLTDAALTTMPANLSEKMARELITELHRRFIWKQLTEANLSLYAATDAAIALRKTAAVVLDMPELNRILPQSFTTTKKALYADNLFIAVYDGAAKKTRWRLIRKSPATTISTVVSETSPGEYFLFGAAATELGGAKLTAYLPPFYAHCPECQRRSDNIPERLIILTGDEALARSLRNDLADNFSVVAEASHIRECAAVAGGYDDSLIFSGRIAAPAMPCNTKPEKIIIDGEGMQAAFPLGWKPGLSLILLPQNLSLQAKTSFLFDFFQRTNRRQVKAAEAFREAKARAEKSFPGEMGVSELRYYESQP
jgi:hypothetical protein